MTEKIEIFARNLEVTDRINDYIHRKLDRMQRKLSSIDEIRVDLAQNKSARNAADRQIAQLTIRGKGFILRTEERADDIFTAIDAALDKMKRQIERYKGKKWRNRGSGMPASEVIPTEYFDDDTEEVSTIARRKKFILHPMNELEAIEQMSLLGHENFFIFYNANTSEINVLYKRRDGTYGLIEPSLG